MLHLLLLFSFLTYKSPYCSCSPLGPIDDKQYNEYNLNVKGRVTKVLKSNFFEKTIYLKVETYYKGVDSLTTLKITTPSQEGMCGIVPKVGEEWVMFAYAEKKRFSTQLCTRTKNMNPKAWDYNKDEIANDIKFLEEKLSTNSR
jgi:hypothetical protein